MNKIFQKSFVLVLGLLVGTIGISSVYAISSYGWTVNNQDTNFDGTGNVGVGTLAPGSKLDVSGMVNIKSINDQSSQLVLQPANGTGQKYGFGTDNTGKLYLGRTAGTGGGIYGDLTLVPNGTTGKVGINTYTPSASLDVIGSFRNYSPGDGTAQFVLTPNNGTGWNYGMGTVNAGGLYFGRVSGIAGGVYTDMFINSTGNIGFGTNAPSEKVDIVGNIKLSGNIKSGGNDICIGKC